MKKIISVLLISFFAFSSFEIYATPSAPKSCCCPSAKMCKCKHEGGACPLTFREGSDKDSKDLLIKLAGCGAGNSPVVSQQFQKDLIIDAESHQLLTPLFTSFVKIHSEQYDFLSSFSFDKPPNPLFAR